tara:strand:+ start:294 stop:599 length:306 start_codon:yes stop_codon:yes gene_type:complete
MTIYLKRIYPSNPHRPNTGAFKDRSFTTAVALNGKLNPSVNEYGVDDLLQADKFIRKYGYEDCSKEEYHKIIKENADIENYITKPADNYNPFKLRKNRRTK